MRIPASGKPYGTLSRMTVVVFFAGANSKRWPLKVRPLAIKASTWSALAKCNINDFAECCIMLTIWTFIISAPNWVSRSSNIPANIGAGFSASAGIVPIISLLLSYMGILVGVTHTKK